jgi:hypothetical protein
MILGTSQLVLLLLLLLSGSGMPEHPLRSQLGLLNKAHGAQLRGSVPNTYLKPRQIVAFLVHRPMHYAQAHMHCQCCTYCLCLLRRSVLPSPCPSGWVQTPPAPASSAPGLQGYCPEMHLDQHPGPDGPAVTGNVDVWGLGAEGQECQEVQKVRSVRR